MGSWSRGNTALGNTILIVSAFLGVSVGLALSSYWAGEVRAFSLHNLNGCTTKSHAS